MDEMKYCIIETKSLSKKKTNRHLIWTSQYELNSLI